MFKKKLEKTPAKTDLEPMKVRAYPVGIVLDGVLQDVMLCDVRMQALVLSSPTFVDLSDMESKPALGSKYDPNSNLFTA